MARKIRDTLVRTILDRIFRGELAAGERLPSIGELARTHGMSAASAREAIQKLALMGLIQIRQGEGTFLDENIPSILEILEARKYVEMATSLLASRNATKKELQELDALIAEMRDAYRREDTATYTQLDLAFHLAIGRMSKNALLAAFLVNIQDLLHYLQQRTHMLQGTLEQANRYHPLIAESIGKRDGNAAQVLMAEHIEAVRRAWGAYDRTKGKRGGTRSGAAGSGASRGRKA